MPCDWRTAVALEVALPFHNHTRPPNRGGPANGERTKKPVPLASLGSLSEHGFGTGICILPALVRAWPACVGSARTVSLPQTLTTCRQFPINRIVGNCAKRRLGPLLYGSRQKSL